MGLETTFTVPKRTKKQLVLDKHGYFEKVYISDDKRIRFIVPHRGSMYDAIAGINEGVSGHEHYDGAIVLNENEKWKEFFIHLRWVAETGTILCISWAVLPHLQNLKFNFQADIITVKGG